MRSLTATLVILVATGTAACSAGEGSDGPSIVIGKARTAIVHGTSSPATQDSVVMINLGADGFCSGTLIAPNVVLTARHCVSNLAQDQCGTIQGDIALATLGIVVGAAAGETSAAVAHAKKYFYVDGAKDLCGPVDIALVLLDRSLTTATSPVRAEAVTVGETLLAVGYGEDENHALAGRRQRAGVQAVAVGPATKTFTPTDGAAAFTYQLPLGEIATSEAACHGDSGGPIFDSQGRVVGVTSRGADPKDVCVARPDIYSAVSVHMDVVDRALTEAGFPRGDAAPTGDTSSKPDRATPTGADDSADDPSDDTTETTPAPKKKKSSSLGAQSAGCAVSTGSTPSSSSPGGSFRGLLLFLGVGFARVLRRRR